MRRISLRLYVSRSFRSYPFDLGESDISRELSQRLFPTLLLAPPVPLRDAPLRAQPKDGTPEEGGPGRQGIRTIEALFQAYPALKKSR
jgi:hypothetical protein